MPERRDDRTELRRLTAAYGVSDADRDRKLALITGQGPSVRWVLIGTWMHAAVLTLSAHHIQECAAPACRTCVGITNMLAMRQARLAADDSDDFRTIIQNLNKQPGPR